MMWKRPKASLVIATLSLTVAFGAAHPVSASPPEERVAAPGCKSGVDFVLAAPVAARTYVVRGKYLNVRVAPGIGCARLGRVKHGTRLAATGHQAKATKVLWRQVASKYGLGWVAASYLQPA